VSKAATDFWPVGLIIQLFVEAGCELRVAEPTVVLEDGDCLNVRYLIKTSTKTYVPLVDLEDDQFVSESEVAFWERRLELTIGRPSLH
jgi:hypothetical protein